MIIVFFGPQGSGKGTQARLLAEKLGYFYFEAGGFLRELSNTTRPDIGERIDKGNLIPGEEMFGLVKNFFEEKKITDDVVFDGFPRTIEQYNAVKPWFVEKSMKIDLAIVLRISEEESVKRLSARRQDPETGKIYNLITDPPGPEVDQSKLTQREDDTPDAIRKRLSLYKENTEPLIAELKKDVEIMEIDGERPIDVIQADIEAAVKERMEK